MIPLRIPLILAVLAVVLPGAVRAGERLIVCGGPEVFVIPADAERVADKDRRWRWRAADSPEIPVEMHMQFRTTDECNRHQGRSGWPCPTASLVQLVRCFLAGQPTSSDKSDESRRLAVSGPASRTAIPGPIPA